MQTAGVAKNRSIDATIQRCFTRLLAVDESAFRRKFGQQSHDNDQVMHTFRELVVGAYLAEKGEIPRYERAHSGVTPDWTLLNEESGPKAILELANFHASRAEETEMRKHLEDGEIYVGWQADPSRRLYQALQQKIDKYSDVVAEFDVPYVVAIFSDFLAAIDFEELQEVAEVVYGEGVFAYSVQLSGILFFEENAGSYLFRYLGNSNAVRPVVLPNGEF